MINIDAGVEDVYCRVRMIPHRQSTGAEMGKNKKTNKLFVLDTNVLIYDPHSLFRFADNDIFLPMTTIEELDHNKKGPSDVARSCRQASRLLDEIVTKGLAAGVAISAGFTLNEFNGGKASGKLFLQSSQLEAVLPVNLPSPKGDNEILKVALALKARETDRVVVLVSKDINFRIKAAALGLEAEDYWNDTVLEDADLLYTGMKELPDDFWERAQEVQSFKRERDIHTNVSGVSELGLIPNMFVHGKGNGNPFVARVASVDGDRASLVSAIDYTSQKNAVWGLMAKNDEQSHALNLLLNPEIDLVTILGQAGSGKTILTLAAALHLLYEEKRHTEMIFTRITVPVGEEIGFLPGTEEEKMMPWMGAVEDNLEALQKMPKDSGDWGKQATKDVLWSKIKVKSMSFMRGRTFLNKFLVIDEAQNLTPKQVKTLITRAGEGTKVVCLGNLAQIDAPYLTEGNCGLSYLVERMKGWENYGHITLARVERSRLADFAASVL